MLDEIEHDWRKEFKRLEGAYATSTMLFYRAWKFGFVLEFLVVGRALGGG